MEPSNQLTARKCILCRDNKLPPAFVGGREVCRLCWIDIPVNERSRYILNEQAIELRRKRLNIPKRITSSKHS